MMLCIVDDDVCVFVYCDVNVVMEMNGDVMCDVVMKLNDEKDVCDDDVGVDDDVGI